MLIANHLSKTYRNGSKALPVLTDVNLELTQGILITIMGPSGCGKSTLLNILGSLDKPDSGTLTFKDQNLLAMKPEKLAEFRNRHLGFVFQFHHLLPEFTALENATIPAKISENREGADYVNELFDLMGLHDRNDHFPAELSGGERVRVALARAMVNRPEIILADEPTGNLDQDNASKVLELFSAIRDRYKQSIVVTTHNPEVASQGDLRYILVQGTLKLVSSI